MHPRVGIIKKDFSGKYNRNTSERRCFLADSKCQNFNKYDVLIKEEVMTKYLVLMGQSNMKQTK